MLTVYLLRSSKGRNILCQSVAHNDLPDADYVLVAGGHERVDLPQGSDGKALFLLVQFELFEGDDVAGLFVLRAEDDAVGTFFDRV